MFNWLRRKRLSPDARKRLLLVAARAEEALVETHVSNLLDLMDTLGEEADFDRAIEIYTGMIALEESRASAVTNRLLARLDAGGARAGRPRRYRNVFREDAR
jgi:hypothetical protein